MKVLVAIYSPVVAWNIHGEYVDRLRREFPHHEFVHARTGADVSSHIGSTHIAFIADLNPRQFEAARSLRWIHCPMAGVGGMLFAEMVASPVMISNSRGMSGHAIAEHVITLVLAFFRKVALIVRSQAARQWAQNDVFTQPLPRTISGSSVLIVGVGGIGKAVAQRFAALGADVTAVRRTAGRDVPEGITAVFTADRLLDCLPHADVVVIGAPETGSTRHMIGRRELEAMRPDALLINVSRGQLVDEAALASALAAGRIGGAGLDVFEREPLDPESPLWTLPNVIITPHMAGFHANYWDHATDLFAENLRRFEASQPLLNLVDKTAGY